jgi:hypothetical protein
MADDRKVRDQICAEDRAAALLDSPQARHFFNALDELGWMVVPQRPLLPGEDKRWPVPIGTRAKWPSWCNHEFAALPKLRLVKKHPDDGAPR